MSKKIIAVIGEGMVELQRNGGVFANRFSGDTLNAAIYLARLLPAATFQVNYVTGIGTDRLSDEMRSYWEAEGISSAWTQHIKGKLPGVYLIETDPHGERSFLYWRNDSAARYWLQGDQIANITQNLTTASWLYISGISLAILTAADQQKLLGILRTCRQQGAKIIFDNNYRPLLWQSTEQAREVYRQILSLTDIAMLTIDDEIALYGESTVSDVIARTRALGVAEVVIKQGAGASVVDIGGQRFVQEPKPISHIVDTTAAGDSFAAAYLAARIEGCTPDEALRAGHWLAGLVIQHKGPIIPLAQMQFPKVDG